MFCEEQGVSLGAEQDGRDAVAIHLVVPGDGGPAGTCRLLMEDCAARLGRMAVDPAFRGTGVGAALLREAGRVAASAGAPMIRLHAQTYARGVYDRAGYEARGAPFMEQGIEHVTMEKRVA